MLICVDSLLFYQDEFPVISLLLWSFYIKAVLYRLCDSFSLAIAIVLICIEELQTYHCTYSYLEN